MHVYVRARLEFNSKQSIGQYGIVFDSVMAMQHSCTCEFGNGSQRHVPEWKKNSCVGEAPVQNCDSSRQQEATHTKTGKNITEPAARK